MTRKNINAATLTKAVEKMDRLSQHATDEIVELASTTLERLDVAAAAHLTGALDFIHNLARDSALEIQTEATQVGCQDTPEDAFRLSRPRNARALVSELREAANQIDIYYQEATRKIMGIAASAKVALGSGELERMLPQLPALLTTVRDLAQGAQNLVNSTAESVGANYIEPVPAVSTTAMDLATEALRVGDEVSDLDELETGIVTALYPNGAANVSWTTGYEIEEMPRDYLLLEVWSRLPAEHKASVKGTVLALRQALAAA